MSCLIIFFDLCKAFETINHDLILLKLQRLAVRGEGLKWNVSYFDERKQIVTMNGQNLKQTTFLLSVPQVSILDPLLFLVFINDLTTPQ